MAEVITFRSVVSSNVLVAALAAPLHFDIKPSTFTPSLSVNSYKTLAEAQEASLKKDTKYQEPTKTKITLGYGYDALDTPQPFFEINGENWNRFIAFNKNGDLELILHMRYDHIKVALKYPSDHNIPATLNVVFNWDGNSFHGACQLYDAPTEKPYETYYAYIGHVAA